MFTITYTGNRFSIRARVTFKTEKKQYAKGNFFTVNLIDESKVEIQAAFFLVACDLFFDLLEVDKVMIGCL